MKRISFSGTFTVSDKVFDYLQKSEHLAGVDQVGMYRANDTFLYFIHDALEDWVNMKQQGLLQDSQQLQQTLAETNNLLRMMLGVRGAPVSNVPLPIQPTPQEPVLPVPAPEPMPHPQENQNPLPAPQVEEPAPAPISEPEPKPEPAPRQLSPVEIRERLNGFIRK